MWDISFCNPLLARRLEHAAIGTGRAVVSRQREVQELPRQNQRLAMPQGHLHFEIAARIDTQASRSLMTTGIAWRGRAVMGAHGLSISQTRVVWPGAALSG